MSSTQSPPMATRTGAIHKFDGSGDGPDAAAFSAPDDGESVPVEVIDAHTLKPIGSGELIGAAVIGDELVGTVEWPESIEAIVGAGAPQARCRFAADGSLKGVVIELDTGDEAGIDDESGEQAALSDVVPKSEWGLLRRMLAAFRDWPARARDELDESDFGEPPDGFPIKDQTDVDSASRLIGKASDPDAVKARIIGIAKRKGLTIPAAWKEKAAMSGSVVFSAAIHSNPIESDWEKSATK